MANTPDTDVPDDSTRPDSVRLRPNVAGLPAYVPGAAGNHPGIFKLSSNEVPDPPAPGVLAALADGAVDANRYPQMYGDDLCAELAAHHGVDPAQVIIGNGSVALIELVLRAALTDGDEVIYAWRSFEAYPILVQVTGATSVQVPGTTDGHHDLEAMLAAITDRTRVIIVCTPNNPTGQALTHTQVAEFLAQVPPHILVILDEAYIHFDRSDDVLNSGALLAEFKNLIALRTFSKAYGLAALRVGYGIGRPRLIRQLRSASTPFGVNALAQAAARAALTEHAYVGEVIERVIAERTRVVAELLAQGWNVGDPQGNFYWLALGELSASFAADALAAGCTVRPFREGVRITIGEPEANDLVLALTRRWADRRATTNGAHPA